MKISSVFVTNFLFVTKLWSFLLVAVHSQRRLFGSFLLVCGASHLSAVFVFGSFVVRILIWWRWDTVRRAFAWVGFIKNKQDDLDCAKGCCSIVE